MKKPKLYFVLSAAILNAVAIIVLHIFLPEYRDRFIVFCVGVLMCIVAVSAMIDSYHCKTKVSAVLIDYGFEQFKAHITSYPIFTYRYQDKIYTEACKEALSPRYVVNHYKKDETYSIYVSVKDPTYIKLSRRVRVFDLGMLIMGLCFVALSVYSLLLVS